MTRATLWIGSSWKMNKTLAEAGEFIDELAAYPLPPGLRAFVLPAHTALAYVRHRLPADSPILLGAQNAHWEPEGSVTGEVSMRMVRDAGASIVELGHSERREAFGESDRTVAAKVRAALAEGLTPLVCVGEPAEVRHAGNSEDFVERQVRAALAGTEPGRLSRVMIAYEPIWAIGPTGTAATPAQTAPVLARIAAVVSDLSGTEEQGICALLYGGGVDAGNLAGLLDDPHVDGLFVGRAGWTAAGFIELLRLSAPYAASRQGTDHRTLAHSLRSV